ncbi:MAG TPA: FAD-dependent oxidoreductase [Mesotoga sp.]|nr:FAD-dependent oxidoreductase [Mesotoga sp.]
MSIYDGLKKTFWGPTIAWKRLFTRPVTIKVPEVYREAAERYRGFHVNDWDKCSGCSTCSKICPTDAIRMVPVDITVESGKKAQRPAIDYGRCSFCAMCVDICTTGSLNMTREYIHISDDPGTFFFLPDETGIHHDIPPMGYSRDENSELLDLERVVMKELPGEERIDSFIEFVKGYSREQAIAEAARCVDCELCVEACPVNMDIPRYIESVFHDDTEEGANWIYKTNPLPSVCGRVCTHKCETVCSIGNRGKPLAIRWLKRYIMDQEKTEDVIRYALNGEVVKKVRGKVAIIGAGPAGLSAAYYLSLMGYSTTIFESKALAGGVMRYGIPRYRLPDEALDKDIKVIESLGVEIKCLTTVGKDVTLEEIRDEYDAVFLGTGFSKGRSTGVEGVDSEGVIMAIPLLEKIRDYLRQGDGEKPPVTDSVIVIGGGNVAMDAARSVARIQKMERNHIDVKVTSLESMEEMPADLEEILEGKEEGIKYFPSRGPKEVLLKDGKIYGLKTIACTRVFDDDGRFNPRFDESDLSTIEGTMIIEAIGQAPDYDFLPVEIKGEIQFIRGRILVNEKGQTALAWLFAGGDIVNGPDIIHGVADGHRAATGIDEFLAGVKK